jgi:hypothetical protein
MEWKKISLDTSIPELPKYINNNFSSFEKYLDIFFDKNREILIRPLETGGKIKGATGEFVTMVVDNLVVKSQYTNLYDNNTTADYNYYKMTEDGPSFGRDACIGDGINPKWPYENPAWTYVDVQKPFYKLSNENPVFLQNKNLSQVVGITLDPSLYSGDPYQIVTDACSGNMYTLNPDPSNAEHFYLELICTAYDVSWGPTWEKYKWDTGSIFQKLDALDACVGDIKTIIEEDVFVDVEVGAVEAGETILEGTTLTELVQMIFTKVYFPTYTPPSATMTRSGSATYEVGTNAPITLTVTTFNRGSINGDLDGGVWNPALFQNFRAGALDFYIINGVNTGVINNDAIVHPVVQGTNTFTSQVFYLDGPQPIDSKGNNYNSPLPAGSVSPASVSVTGRFLQFFGAAAAIPANSADVRALPNNNFDNMNSFNLTTGTVHTDFIVAIPEVKSIVSVIDTTNLNLDVTADYILINASFTVNDIGGTPRTYKLYAMTNASPYSPSATHVVTVS